jgi:hypothetical protein
MLYSMSMPMNGYILIVGSKRYAYPMFDISNINQSGLAYVRIRSGIDVDELPLPLKSSSLWDNDWELESDWFEWDIAPSQ